MSKTYALYAALSASMMAMLPTDVSALEPASGPGRTIEVSFADLDLGQESDRDELRTRVDRAIRRACPARIQGPVRIYPDHRVCREQAWRETEAKLVAIYTLDPAERVAVSRLTISRP